MYIVHCPDCVGEVPIMDEAIERREINWNYRLVYCPECGFAFYFDDEDVLQVRNERLDWE